ncbi:MAG: DegT/DnrJ/EryC1/StrS family aminotransferase, partial [Candidatus Latescibacteria bacterium]|nr:DegT/DnrJ/EryC1/StrS family aminotransferase [Candidatus Latescibacterota bacterium]
MAELALLGGEREVKEKDGILWPMYDAAERDALIEVLESRAWYNSSKCQEFEETFAAFQDAKYGVACTGGTVALVMICRGGGIGVGDEVFTRGYRFIGWCWGVVNGGG